jgi:hypothetical protein
MTMVKTIIKPEYMAQASKDKEVIGALAKLLDKSFIQVQRYFSEADETEFEKGRLLLREDSLVTIARILEIDVTELTMVISGSIKAIA